MNIRKSMTVLAASALVASIPHTAIAEGGGASCGPIARMKHVLESKNLALSSDQKDALRGVFRQTKELCGSKSSDEERKSCWQASRDTLREQTRSVLTDEQRSALDEAKKAWFEKHKDFFKDEK